MEACENEKNFFKSCCRSTCSMHGDIIIINPIKSGQSNCAKYLHSGSGTDGFGGYAVLVYNA